MTGGRAADGGARADRWRPMVWGAIVALVLAPLVAMRFTTEMDWTLGDFAVFGALLAAAGGAYELATRVTGGLAYRLGFGLAIVAAFLMVWANLAVGIIGDEDNRTNLVFYGIVLTGAVGAWVAELKPRGMARTMLALAAIQGLAAVMIGTGPEGFFQFYVFSAAYAAIWLAAAWLFSRAARTA